MNPSKLLIRPLLRLVRRSVSLSPGKIKADIIRASVLIAFYLGFTALF